MKRRFYHSLAFRISLFSLLLVFLPAAGVLILDTYENQLLKAQEKAMVVLGRSLSAALSGGASGDLETRAQGLIQKLGAQHEARVRVLDLGGRVLADSARLKEPREPGAPVSRSGYEASLPEPQVQESWLYQLGALPVRVLRWFLGAPELESPEDIYKTNEVVQGPEILKAREGRYGAATRRTPGQVSVTLYSALPVPSSQGVQAVVLVTQSTYRILRDLYTLRVDVFKVILWSLAAALALGVFFSLTLTNPLKKLARRAGELTDFRGRLSGTFEAWKGKDEIGDLSRALNQLTQRLHRHMEFLEGFSQDLAHELKNPLASVRSASENLLTSPPRDQAEAFHRIIQQDLQRMDTLINGIREIGRLDARTETEPAEPQDLVILTRSAVEEFSLRSGRAVKLSLPPGPLRFSLPAHRWHQVIDNLLENAQGFSPDQDSLEVTLEAPGPRLTVRDRGPGVPPEDRQRIFDRFFSLRSPQDKMQHAGLGLAIVKALVTGWGGRVWVEDAQPGARFLVDLGAAE